MHKNPASCAAINPEPTSEPSAPAISRLSLILFSEGGCQEEEGNVALALGGWSSANTSEV